MDSNAVENRIRPLALNRKNALFAGHDEGDAAWGRIASLIETAKMNRVEPYAYLKATLAAIAHGIPHRSSTNSSPGPLPPIHAEIQVPHPQRLRNVKRTLRYSSTV